MEWKLRIPTTTWRILSTRRCSPGSRLKVTTREPCWPACLLLGRSMQQHRGSGWLHLDGRYAPGGTFSKGNEEGDGGHDEATTAERSRRLSGNYSNSAG